MDSLLRRWIVSVLIVLTAGHTYAASPERPPDDDLYFSWDGFRIARYRSPTPDEAEGGQHLDTAAVQVLMQQTPAPVLLDVQPVRWQDGVFLQTQPRRNLPDSVWLPNVGLGELEPAWTSYFKGTLERITEGNSATPIIIYCTADCWMSWNAVKRAHSWGYTRLYWYAEGSDGWQEADLELVKAHPQPFSLADHTEK
ncbi:PQQ-dependent catabolism-associated CXXCW motif protein [Marinobacterium halophilum]|uniref:PQQ-dependent catabolism-associated CXXCW motif protein n=1 Tax=Marinobacterium halophilum TaxID=267374 RepID=A0A2P8EKL4_9GAMM|nr:rhodanese-like domain-containing protein [Marinobacterium halophilum]PSL10020.1 PQQ-dependent catabolism-associated CXXCW motif protein [Marinobacterium halophilum]